MSPNVIKKLFIINTVLLFLSQQISTEKLDYILNAPSCKIPNLSVFDDELKTIMRPQSYLSCNTSELLSFVEKTGENAILHIRKDLFPQYSAFNVTCCYSYVKRKGTPKQPDVGIEISECVNFAKRVHLTKDTVKVACMEHVGKISYLIYENVHNPITVKNPVKNKLKSQNQNSERFSVLFVVVDSISRLNFIRTMPQTHEFLQENDFIEMKGYSKVAENTFPNFLALLTGFSSSNRCNPYVVGGLDVCPMIWYDYRREGYITAYAEDDTPITTFNYQKKGFVNPPTDYYFKPYVEATETLPKIYHNTMAYCTGPETAGERILNLAKDFASTFKNHSSFGIFWMNTFSHNTINAPYGMDIKMKNFFFDLKNLGVLDESIVIFLSDHGMRFGRILTTQRGWFEERTPINMISVPEKFQKKFPKLYENLRNNSNKLTSTYDMHRTLQHILVLSGTSYRGQQNLTCPKCLSLFEEIPENRTCEDAGLLPQWCTCMGHFHHIDSQDKLVKNLTNIIVGKIKRNLSPLLRLTSTFCSNVEVGEILTSTISESLEDDPEVKFLHVSFKTIPSATLHATVKFKNVITSDNQMYVKHSGYDLLNLCLRRGAQYP